MIIREARECIWMISAVLAVFRIGGVTHEAFQALAHLWVGFSLWAWLVEGYRDARRAVVILSVIEIACAFYYGVGHP